MSPLWLILVIGQRLVLSRIFIVDVLVDDADLAIVVLAVRVAVVTAAGIEPVDAAATRLVAEMMMTTILVVRLLLLLALKSSVDRIIVSF